MISVVYLAITIPIGILTLGGGRQIDLLGAGVWWLIDVCWKCLMLVILVAGGISLYLNRFLMGVGCLLRGLEKNNRPKAQPFC